MARSLYGDAKEQEFVEEVLNINRVSKVVKGGRRFGFTALCAVGNQKNQVGLGFARGSEVVDAIQKGFKDARKNMIDVIKNDKGFTVPYKLEHEYCSTKIIVKPTRPGTGVIAGGPARSIFTLAGIRDVTCKYHGSNNPINCAKAAFEVLKRYEEPREIIRRRKAEPVVTSVEDVIEEQVEQFNQQVEQKKEEVAARAGEAEEETVGAPSVSEEEFRQRSKSEPAAEEASAEPAVEETEADEAAAEDEAVLEGEPGVDTATATSEEVAEAELEDELEADSGEATADEAAEAAEADETAEADEDSGEEEEQDPPGLAAAGDSAEAEAADEADEDEESDDEEDEDEKEETE